MSQNPYKVLGVEENATPEAIKKAYTDMVKKYHPDRYKEDYMKELAEQKMKEINEAYDAIQKGNGYSSYSWREDTSRQTADQSRRSESFGSLRDARMQINGRNFSKAREILQSLTQRDAEWFFLMGIVEVNYGNYDQGKYYINEAVMMDPGNQEYRQAYQQIFSGTIFSQNANPYNRYDTSQVCCQACAAAWCLDVCCECGGGDFINCC